MVAHHPVGAVPAVMTVDSGASGRGRNPIDVKPRPSFAAPSSAPGKVAQLVEQRTENPCVPGSIPGLATTYNQLVTSVLALEEKTVLSPN